MRGPTSTAELAPETAAGRPRAKAPGGRTAEWMLVAAITLGAAVLRIVHIGAVPPDPFYDAAVRSMGLSWHNFFFGAFEPGGSVSIDKPPVDLWLQVISVKLLGFSSTTLKLPEVLAGTAAVPLLYVLVRRLWNAAAGIAAAAAMAVLPIAVITARSDTMDGVMMLFLVLAALAAVRAAESGRLAWLFAAAAALGVAFDVKLLESLVALPAIAAIAYFGMPGSRVRRLLRIAAATAVYVAVALSWLTATLLFPAHDRPYAIGSTNGSAWNAAFVFNGSDRLGGKSPEPGATAYEAGHHYAVATQAERDHIPIVPPSPTRLLARVGPLSGERLGLEMLVALLLGIPALAWGLRGSGEPPGRDPTSTVRERDDELERRLRRATAAGLGLWMLAGLVLFSHMIRLHPALRRRLHAGGRGDVRHRRQLGSVDARRRQRPAGAALEPCRGSPAPGVAGGDARDHGRATASDCCTGHRACGGSPRRQRSAPARWQCWRASRRYRRGRARWRRPPA